MVDAVPSPAVPVLPVVLALPHGESRDAEIPGLLPLGGVTLLQRLLLSIAEVCPARTLVVTAPSALGAVERIVAGRADAIATSGAGRLGALADALRHLGGGVGSQPVLVHEAERALTPSAAIAGVVSALVDDVDAVVPGLPVTDSVKARGSRGLRNVDRERLTTLQSPRVLRRDVLDGIVEAAATGERMPDDEIRAAIARGARVRVVPGSHQGGAVVDRLGLWQAQIALGLARDTTPVPSREEH